MCIGIPKQLLNLVLPRQPLLPVFRTESLFLIGTFFQGHIAAGLAIGPFFQDFLRSDSLLVLFFQDIWRPDSFFKNAKQVTFQRMTIPNHYLWLYKNKQIMYMVK
jgi:hypothetical protein